MKFGGILEEEIFFDPNDDEDIATERKAVARYLDAMHNENEVQRRIIAVENLNKNYEVDSFLWRFLPCFKAKTRYTYNFETDFWLLVVTVVTMGYQIQYWILKLDLQTVMSRKRERETVSIGNIDSKCGFVCVFWLGWVLGWLFPYICIYLLKYLAALKSFNERDSYVFFQRPSCKEHHFWGV